MHQMEFTLHLAASVLSTAAAVCALYNIQVSRKTRAWLLFCAAFILLSVERLTELLAHAALLDALFHEVVSDIFFAIAASCLFAGTCFLRTIFQERNTSQHMLEQKLNELRRFHEVTIGRELRMKELYEENRALKTRLNE